MQQCYLQNQVLFQKEITCNHIKKRSQFDCVFFFLNYHIIRASQ